MQVCYQADTRQEIFSGGMHLKHLKLVDCAKLTAAALSHLADFLANTLVELFIGDAPLLTAAGARAELQRFHALRYLFMPDCKGLASLAWTNGKLPMKFTDVNNLSDAAVDHFL